MRRVDEHSRERVGITQIGDVERTADTVIGVRTALLLLGALKQRQHIMIPPPGVASRLPFIVDLAVPTHIDHGVDRAGAAEHLAARPSDAALIELWLRFGTIGPVHITLL